MAAALAEFISKQLISLATDQASLLWGLKTEIPKLANTVSSIQAVLLDAEEQSGESRLVQLWLRGLEDVLYEAEDVLDDFSTEVHRRKQMDGNSVVNEVCLFFSPDNQIAYGLKIANQIKAVRSKLEEIDRNRNQFNFQTRRVEPNKEWRQTHSSVPDVVVGREGDKQIIIDMLLSSSYEEKFAVVPIVGIGGLGKTALAQLVYNDDKIKSHFDSRCWVCVSETFEPKVLIKNILESITKKKVEDFALNTLKDLLHEQIKNKRLLLVLDDVWNEDPEKWASFMNILSSGATTGSRIVGTTRLRIVAEMTATETIVPHELQGLSDDDSWSLFEKMAFKGGVASDPRYIEIGKKKILRKCCGVPLAIRTMGGLLFFKETVSEWERIAGKQLLNLGLGGLDSEILERTLKLSYDNLPSHLKRCFAYCSLFPKDHIIDVKMVVQFWMAQGFIIKSSQSSQLADIGIEYFKNLLWRSFFQEAEKDRWGNIRYCKMHDLVHDLAIKVAGEETICLNASNLTDSLLNINLERIRHLSIDFEKKQEGEVWQLPSLLAKATRLRTFLIINVYYKGVTLQGRCEKIFPNMTTLRVLGLPHSNIETVSPIIHVLKHLRYLDLSYNKEMEILPNKITRLINLQVLNLCGCKNLRLLSADIGKLFNLGYLVLHDCESLTCIPAGIGNLSFLRELSHFIVAEAAAVATADGSSQAAGLGELKSLNNLSGELSIRGLGRVTDKSEAEAANLKEKSQLQCLKLCWIDHKYMNRRILDADPNQERSVLEALQPHPNLKEIQLQYYGGTCIPTSCCWFSSLRNLVRMELEDCWKLRSLPSLDPLVSLEELVLLKLESLEYVQSLETSSSSSNNDFQSLPSLHTLHIRDCRNLIGWSPTSVQDSPLLPKVSRLTIWNCPKMVSVLRFRVNFEDVTLIGLSNEVLSVFAASLISPPTHPRFHSLWITNVKNLSLQGLMPHLTSLERLIFYNCDDLTTISPSILRHLPSLQELGISNCPVLELEDYDYGDGDDDDENNNTLCVLSSLHLLHFNNVPKLFTLPKWLQHSSNLRQLDIWNCKNLKCLPSWLTKLTALEYLVVKECDILCGRCRSNTAEDWPNISHIPNIRIDYIYVQKDGCYLTVEEQLQQQLQQQEEEAASAEEEEEEEEEEASSHTQISSYRVLLETYFARITCNLFQRCFLP